MLTERAPRVNDGRGIDLDEVDAWLLVQGLLVIEWQPGLASPTLRRPELVRVRELLHRLAPLLPPLPDHVAPAGALDSCPPSLSAGAT